MKRITLVLKTFVSSLFTLIGLCYLEKLVLPKSSSFEITQFDALCTFANGCILYYLHLQSAVTEFSAIKQRSEALLEIRKSLRKV